MKTSSAERKFELVWRSVGNHHYQREHRFHPSRRWRFDFAWPYPGDRKGGVAVEIEGGIWVNGAHSRGKHFTSDCEKYFEASMNGWTVIRLVPSQVTVDTIQRLADFISKEMGE